MRDQALWTWHIISAAVIGGLLGLHMAIMHLDALLGIFNPAGGHPVDWENVVARSKEAGFAVNYVLLLAAGLFHGFYGLRNILFELNPGKGLRGGITLVLIAGGFGLFALGTWAVIAGFQKAGTV
jgi:succinate dehydrogenase hydrophobic anchor subunit